MREFLSLAASQLDYNKSTGVLTWKKSGTGRKADLSAGYRRFEGIWIRIGPTGNNKSMLAQNIVWYIVTGDAVPDGKKIKHKNQKTNDNRFKNLELVDSNVKLERGFE